MKSPSGSKPRVQTQLKVFILCIKVCTSQLISSKLKLLVLFLQYAICTLCTTCFLFVVNNSVCVKDVTDSKRWNGSIYSFFLVFLQLFRGPALPSAAPCLSLDTGSALGMTLDRARWCFSSVTQVTLFMVPVPSGVRQCPAHWPNGTALCQHVSVCTPPHVCALNTAPCCWGRPVVGTSAMTRWPGWDRGSVPKHSALPS